SAASDVYKRQPETAPEPEKPALAREPSEPPIAPKPEEPPAPEPTPAAPASGNVATALPKPLFKNVKASCGRDAGVGTKLKSFRLKDLEGKEVTNGRYRKRVMLVNFWGTWCAPCLKELPEFDRLYRRYRKAGMTLVAIATDEDAEPVKQLVAKRKLRAKVLIGGETYAGQYGAPNFPFTYVVDTTGTIVASYHGYKEDCMGKLEDDIRKALEKR
ncbi:MAG: TlpA family protein disulfide reductase, partial [Nannocystaceae bacterium]|nr:TlpA family protein disulfide reductase [Nannocystaceae bacterium]